MSDDLIAALRDAASSARYPTTEAIVTRHADELEAASDGTRNDHGNVHTEHCNSTKCPCYLAGLLRDEFSDGTPRAWINGHLVKMDECGRTLWPEEYTHWRLPSEGEQ